MSVGRIGVTLATLMVLLAWALPSASAQPGRSAGCRAAQAGRRAHRHPHRAERRMRACHARARPGRHRRPAPFGRASRRHPRGARRTQAGAAIAAALAAPCQNTEATPEAANLTAMRAAVLCLINRVRAQHGELPLTLSADLELAAEEHARELIEQHYFAHVGPDGKTPVDRIRATGYIPGSAAGYVIGENLAWGTYGLSTPAAIVAAWIASPAHRANILEASYSETGIGIMPQVPGTIAGGAPGATYTQEFGAIVR